MKLIVYYSYTGSCNAAAEYLQEKLGGELLSLKEEKPFAKNIFGYFQALFAAFSNKSSNLAEDFSSKVASAELIYLITPIWAGATPPAINTFLQLAELEGKKVNVLTVQGNAKLAGSEKVFYSIKERVENKGGTIDEAQSIQGGTKRKPLSAEQAAERILFK